ncbi:MAG: ATP-dependent sacrificial sulfur transferase LarE, partial [Oscillospiraceae bacterium]|nr:ATP-dependent sacrificial sulfur transferase LarE [Oscillospiraceae bacterium]
GGVDSAFLLAAAIKYDAKVKGYYVKSEFQPNFELQDAKRLAETIGGDLTILEAEVLACESIVSNPPERCYYCKTMIFESIIKQASIDGYPLVADGTNASDDIDDRPGMRALQLLGVRSPLRECNLSKDEIRRLSKQMGLFTWDKPAYACLATRIPTGNRITRELLTRIEGAEDVLFAMGFSDFRVRIFADATRLQFPSASLTCVIEKREDIIKALTPFFSDLLLDLTGR